MVPDWAIGVGVILVALFTGISVLERVAGASERRLLKRKRGVTIGVHLPDGSTGSTAGASPSAESLHDLERRVAELEERVDFAERMLTQHRDAARLAPPEK